VILVDANILLVAEMDQPTRVTLGGTQEGFHERYRHMPSMSGNSDIALTPSLSRLANNAAWVSPGTRDFASAMRQAAKLVDRCPTRPLRFSEKSLEGSGM
jgi:hypothetical protein